MRETLYLYMAANNADSAQWLIANRRRIKKLHTDTLGRIARHCRNRKVILFVPTADVLLTQTNIPSRNKQRLRNAIPYALEEQLIGDVETQLFAMAGSSAPGTQYIAVIAKECFNQWMETLHKAGIRPQWMIPDVLALPYQAGTWTLARAGHGTLVRTGPFSGSLIDSGNESLVLETLYQTAADKPRKLVLAGSPADSHDSKPLREWAERHQLALSACDTQKPLAAILATGADPGRCINLLQGGPSQHAGNTKKFLRPFYPALTAAAAWALLSIALLIVEYRSVDKQVARHKQQAAKLFRQVFPKQKNVHYARPRMQQYLNKLKKRQGRKQYDFITLLGLTGAAVKAVTGVKITHLNYQGGALQIRFGIDRIDKVDQLETRLKHAGLKVTRGSSVSSRTGYTMQMIISMKTEGSKK